MRAVLSKAEFESTIVTRFHDAFRVPEKKAALTLPTGISEVDNLTGGIPRGALSEIFGPASSGRSSLLFSMLAYATAHDEICALIDINDVFAPTAAVSAGIDFDRLLWVRCEHNLEQGFKASDLILHAGGFGLVVLDMGDVSGKEARRIISSWWYRFRRAVENKPTAMMVLSAEACTRSCASLTLELNGFAEWIKTNNQTLNVSGAGLVSHGNLLREKSIKVNRRRPIATGLNESRFKCNYF